MNLQQFLKCSFFSSSLEETYLAGDLLRSIPAAAKGRNASSGISGGKDAYRLEKRDNVERKTPVGFSAQRIAMLILSGTSDDGGFNVERRVCRLHSISGSGAELRWVTKDLYDKCLVSG